MTDYEIVELFKKARNITSDTKAAKALGVSRIYISQIKNGRSKLSEHTATKMVKLAGVQIATAWGELHKRRIMDIQLAEHQGNKSKLSGWLVRYFNRSERKTFERWPEGTAA